MEPPGREDCGKGEESLQLGVLAYALRAVDAFHVPAELLRMSKAHLQGRRIVDLRYRSGRDGGGRTSRSIGGSFSRRIVRLGQEVTAPSSNGSISAYRRTLTNRLSDVPTGGWFSALIRTVASLPTRFGSVV